MRLAANDEDGKVILLQQITLPRAPASIRRGELRRAATGLTIAERAAGLRSYFFSSISVASLRIAGVSFSANLASSQGSVTSRRT